MQRYPTGRTATEDRILSINLLSKCNSLIASGGCSGVGEALKENGGKNENVYIFNLGKNA